MSLHYNLRVQECLYLMIDVRLMDSESTPTSSSAGSDMEDNEVTIENWKFENWLFQLYIK